MHNNPGVLDLNIRKLVVNVVYWCPLMRHFQQSLLIQLGLVLCLFNLWKKNRKFQKLKPVFTISLFITSNLKNHRFSNIVYPLLRLWRYGGPQRN